MRIRQVEMNMSVSFFRFVKFSPENLNKDIIGKSVLHNCLRSRQGVLLM